jgi:enoyl-CoA hydratase/carnithine racemase
LIVERSDGVVRATLNRPSTKNSLKFSLFEEIGTLIDEVERRAEDRILVLRGTNSDFSTGFDIADAEQLIELGDGIKKRIEKVDAVTIALRRMSKPSVAVVDGDAMGAGMSLELPCDLVIASDRARFGVVFVRRGLSISFGFS